jgi:hypothetical protein
VGFNYVCDEYSGSKMECYGQLDNYQLLSEDVYVIHIYLDITYVNKMCPEICLLPVLWCFHDCLILLS